MVVYSSIQGWSSFSTGASNLASQTSEGLSKFGTTLQQNVLKPSAEKVLLTKLVFWYWYSVFQASKFGHYVNDSVIQPTKQKAQEGRLWNDVSTSASQFASKVRN